MSLSEFELIKKFFDQKRLEDENVSLGIGDDAAVIKQSSESDLVVAIDTLVAGVHFPHSTTAYDIGWKALAVNLSDIAAMGASPSWFTLALTIPDSSENWLASFSQGVFDLANQYGLVLVGGTRSNERPFDYYRIFYLRFFFIIYRFFFIYRFFSFFFLVSTFCDIFFFFVFLC